MSLSALKERKLKVKIVFHFLRHLANEKENWNLSLFQNVKKKLGKDFFFKLEKNICKIEHRKKKVDFLLSQNVE